jgi:phosphonate transport system ATP-binding protein
MALITSLAAEDGIPALVNIHDVPLARAFAGRVIGLAEGRIVFDGAPSALDEAAITSIYGGTEAVPPYPPSLRARSESAPSASAGKHTAGAESE